MRKKLSDKLKKSYWQRKFYTSSLAKILFNKKKLRKEVFTSIYDSKHWVQPDNNLKDDQLSVSGHGSYLGTQQTEKLIQNLDQFIKLFNISSIIDIPCGDFLWMDKVISKNKNIKYLGLDIVENLIDKNLKKYRADNIDFKLSDIFEENKLFEEKADLFFTRDFFIHCENKDIINLIKKIKKSRFKYFACESYDIKTNKNVQTGKHRKINIFLEPFNLSEPIFKFQDYESGKFLNFFEVKHL